MPLDSNGIFKYTETDLVGTFSTLLNKGQDSVSAALGAVRSSLVARIAAIENDATDWIAVPAAAGFSSDMRVRRVGKAVFLTGLVTSTTSHTITSAPLNVAHVPAAFAIGMNEYLWPATSTMATQLTALLTTGGAIQLRSFLNGGVGIPAGVSFGIASPWLIRA